MPKTTTTSSEPRHAPANYRAMQPKIVTRDGDGLFERWHGSGLATEIACGACGNVAGNLQIYGNWGFSYPNGNSWDDREIVCGQCATYTTVMEFQEG